MSAQPGWYPDPSVPPGSGWLRWWDGIQWTEHTSGPDPAPPAQYAAQPVQYGAQPVRTTPDGEPLAGWGARLGAYLIDSLLLGVLVVVVALPLEIPLVRIYTDYIRETVDASSTGAAPPDVMGFYGAILPRLVGMVLIQAVLGYLYFGFFYTTRGASLGKQWLGLRLRLREQPGNLTWGRYTKRWLVQYGVGILGAIPLVGGAVSIYLLLDGLWPLWDDKRQALHDKFAGTNVVRTRR